MCEYCQAEVYFKVKRIQRPLLAPLTHKEELEHELLDITGEEYIKVQNSFCPMCGRKLTK